MHYEYAVRELLSSEVPQAYTTIKTEQQAEENMMGVIRVRTRKATVLSRENSPVNWYKAPVVLNGQPFRFPWPTEILRKIINASLRASLNARSNYSSKYIPTPRTPLLESKKIWITSCNTLTLRVFINGSR